MSKRIAYYNLPLGSFCRYPAWQAFEREGKGGFGREGNAREGKGFFFKFYESENFSDSPLYRIFESENFRFPLSTKHSLT